MPAPARDRGRPVGLATRLASWVLDALFISGVAVLVGLGVTLFVALVPLAHNVASVLKPIAAGAFVLWCALYFVAFWTTTGQTPGARMMQIRLVAGGRERVRPLQGLLRWAAMNLAALPLGAGYLPVLVGRRPFPDWVARTLVLDAPQLSRIQARLAQSRLARARDRRAAAGGSIPPVPGGPHPSVAGGPPPSVAGGPPPSVAGGPPPSVAGGPPPLASRGDGAPTDGRSALPVAPPTRRGP